jgi:hypothetical protein
VTTKDSNKSFERRTEMNSARRLRTKSCTCGQQLDVCARAHCPRCGRTLGRD